MGAQSFLGKIGSTGQEKVVVAIDWKKIPRESLPFGLVFSAGGLYSVVQGCMNSKQL